MASNQTEEPPPGAAQAGVQETVAPQTEAPPAEAPPAAASPAAAPQAETLEVEEAHEPLTADVFDDGDSAISTATTSGLTSLRSSVLRFQEENGRTYHSMSGGKYYLPNDERENERLDLMHNLWLLTLRGELGLSPKAIEGAKRVLDAGTGTGIWAEEYADMHPESEVIGVDLSPIQPSLVPPNCSFELDDIEKEWTWTRPFDLIFSRAITGCLENIEDFVRQAYNNLEPGGYLEMQDFLLPYASDDDTIPADSAVYRASALCVDAASANGRPNNLAPYYKSYLERAGFVDVVERRFKWPLNEWPKDPYYKELGTWTRENLHHGIEGLVMALFTRFLGWSRDEVLVFCAQFRTALKDRSIHGYIPIYVVYGRKPGNPPGTEETITADAPNIPDVVDLSIERIRHGLEDGEFTCLDLCEVYLARIAEVNDDLHAVIQKNPDVKAVAASCDADYDSSATRGALHGIPILVKNVFHVNDKMLTTAGSLALAGSHGPVSTAVTNLEKEGAMILGTTNLSEFANFRSEHCPDGWSPLGGQCYGVYAKNQNPSGSSSGSAVAARLGLAAACLGTENNGSITSPAVQAYCVGFKPTVGLVSRHGVISFNEYQDCPGTLARTVENAARVLSVIAGRDPADPITDAIPDISLDFVEACKSSSLTGVRLAVPRADIARDVKEPEILASFEASLAELRKHGATILDDVRYPTWTPDFSRRTLPFVEDQLKTSIERYLSSLSVNPYNLQSPSELWDHMYSLAAEETGKLGGTRFVKALSGPPMDSQEAFAARLTKGTEIATVLDENECDAIIVPEGCRNPSDLGQSPVVCLPMGLYSSSTKVETDEYDLTMKAPDIPCAYKYLSCMHHYRFKLTWLSQIWHTASGTEVERW